MRARAIAMLLAGILGGLAHAQGTIDYGKFGGSGSSTSIVGTTSVCSVGPQGTANGVCLVSSGIDGEGTTANAFETTLAFGDATADATATLTGTAGGALLTVGDGTLAAPSLNFAGGTNYGFYKAGGGVFGGIAGVNQFGFATNTFEFTSGLTLCWGSGAADATACDTSLKRGAAGFPAITQQALTAATMTAENTGQLRTTTSSYTWTNAQVVALPTTAGDITVATLPAKTQVLDAMVVITGAAAGPATVTVSCGDAIAGTPFINYVVPSDAKAAANTVYGDALAERGTSIDTEFWYLPSYTATTLVTCHFISTGANLSTVTGSTGRVILTTRLLP